MRLRFRIALALAAPGVLAALVLGRPVGAEAEPHRYALVSADPADGRALGGSVGAELADGGRWAVFQSLAGGTVWQIFARDLVAGRTVRLSGPGGATSPSISADGRLVSYVEATAGGVRAVVVDRDTDADGVFDEPGATARQPVTGTVPGQPYQAPQSCVAATGGYESRAICPPRLAAGGTALAVPVELSPDAPDLTVHDTSGGSAAAAATTLLDFGSVDGGTAQRSLVVRLAGSRPVNFGAGPLLTADPAFTVTSTTCKATVTAPGTCTIVVAFRTARCDVSGPATRLGTMALRSADGGTHGELGLLGECPTGVSVPAAGGCADRVATNLYATDVTVPPGPAGPPTAWLAPVDARQRRLVSVRVTNPTAEAAPVAVWSARPCELTLVLPEHAEFGPAPCRPGVALPPGAACIAYVLVAPVDPGRIAGSVSVGPGGGHRLVGTATRKVTVVHTDPAGRGRFTGPAEVASLGVGGAVLDAGQVAISADGTALAFVSRDRLDGRPADPATALGSQVYLTVRSAGGAATAVPATVPPAGAGEPLTDAATPAISADGTRVAFTGATSGGTQVYVHDAQTGATVLASRRAAAGPLVGGDSYSDAPDLAADGRTVAYTSTATDLTPSALESAERVYVRYVEADFTGAVAGNEPASPAGANRAALDAHGRQIAFSTTDAATTEDGNDTDDVYLFRRYASPAVEPVTVDFGAEAVDQVGPPRTVTVSNAGPGPLTVGGVAADGPFRLFTDGCLGQVLGIAESCTVGVAFTPVQPGPATGRIRFTTEGASAVGDLVVTLTGNGTDGPLPRLTYEPAVVEVGQVTRVTGTDFPANLTMTLRWQPGGGDLTVTTDDYGRITLDLVILSGQVPGPRRLLATTSDGPVATGDVLLVVPGTADPPDFVRR